MPADLPYFDTVWSTANTHFLRAADALHLACAPSTATPKSTQTTATS